MNKIISLVGLPGSGKTTIGKALRDSFGWFYIDVDEEIEKKTHRKVVDIIREEGEVAFRALESETILKLVTELLDKNAKAVLCPGGGALLSEESRDLLFSKTLVVLLDVNPELQLERVYQQELEQRQKSGKALRPLLSDENAFSKEIVSEKLSKLRSERKHLFSNAHIVVSNNNKDAIEVASEIDKLAMTS